MRVLAMDCSSSAGSVCVLNGEDLLFQKTFPCPRGRGNEVFPVLEEAVTLAGNLARVVVGIGPGSYNGLRVTAAAAEGIALGTGAERVGILSILGLEGGDDFWAAGDARGGTLYLARITDGKLIGDILIMPKSDALSHIQAADPNLPVLIASPVEELPNAIIRHPDAVRLARLGMAASPVDQIQPYYAKPVHITFPSSTNRQTLAAGAPRSTPD